METFEGKVVIVTGASSGIGRALALQLSMENASLVLAARNEVRLGDLRNLCQRNGAKAIAIKTDVSNESQCKQLIQKTILEFGRLDTIINNAGMAVASDLDALPDLHLFKQVVDVNFYGTVQCTYYALPYLRKNAGRIVNISSLGGVFAVPSNASYVASKAAIIGFSDSLRMELAGSGVSVTVICPYWVVSEFHEHYLDKDGLPRGPSGRAFYTDRMMTSEKCARIIVKAARNRKREILLGPGRLGAIIRQVAPSLVDKITMGVVLKPIQKRIGDRN